MYAIVADTGGAHEAECVYSIWSNKEDAEKECDRLMIKMGGGGLYGGEFHVVPINADTASDAWIID